MAYSAQRNSADRTKTVILVALVEAATLYAVVTGLTMTGTVNPEAIFRARNIPATPPATPVDPPRPDKQVRPVKKQTETVAPLPDGLDALTRNELEAVIGTGPDISIEPSPTPDIWPERTIAAVSPARPRGHPGEWVTANDYPAQDLREGNQGVVRFRLEIAANGRVTNCLVTRSSGFPRLDAAACARLISRARFDPARNEAGTTQPGSYNSAVRWTIPPN